MVRMRVTTRERVRKREMTAEQEREREQGRIGETGHRKCTYVYDLHVIEVGGVVPWKDIDAPSDG